MATLLDGLRAAVNPSIRFVRGGVRCEERNGTGQHVEPFLEGATWYSEMTGEGDWREIETPTGMRLCAKVEAGVASVWIEPEAQ